MLMTLQLTTRYTVTLVFALVGFAQNTLRTPSVSSLMDDLRKEPLMAVTVNRLADAKAVEAIPLLKEKFAKITAEPSKSYVSPTDELLNKSIIASALVRLGDPGKEYWNFVASVAQIAAESDSPPFPMELDASGRLVRGKISSEFEAWAKKTNTSAGDAYQNYMYGMQLRMLPLVVTGDPKGLPIFRKVLTSRNYFVQARAAEGVALLRDNDSVPLIIDACSKAPLEYQPVIARALVYFDDSRARQASEKFITNRALLDSYRQKYAKDGPRGMFR